MQSSSIHIHVVDRIDLESNTTLMLTISYIYICVVQTPSVTHTISYIGLYMCHGNVYTYA
jgi:hypothetical protein